MPLLKTYKDKPRKPLPYTVGPGGSNSKRACYDPKTNSYTREGCVRNRLVSHGIGQDSAIPVPYTRAFSKDFGPAFS